MRKLNRGFTLVELMIVVAIIGVLAALAIYGVERYLASSKSAEAKQHVGAISRGAQSAFERTFAASQFVVEGDQSLVEEHSLCDTANSVPNLTPPAGTKYQPDTTDGADFQLGAPTVGWQCLRFAITSPIHYRYSYTRNGSPIAPANPTACVTPGCYEAAAESDLNGDGVVFGLIVRTGKINPATGALKGASQLYVLQEAN